MNKEKLIPIEQLCLNYEVEMSFFYELHDIDLIEIQTIEESDFIHEDKLLVLEKVMRMQKDLNINIEGVDAVMNLLDKINDLQNELDELKNRLRLYEDQG
jgi:hypothetical protein